MPALADLATMHYSTHSRTVELQGYFIAMPRSIFMWAAVDPAALELSKMPETLTCVT